MGRRQFHEDGEVWYAAYGSNLSAARFACYLRGGRPDGARVTLPGCRDRTPARAWRAVEIPGAIHFALESPTWTGGMAFYDPDAGGAAPARAWLVSRQQFCDVVSQEMHRRPGADYDLELPVGGRRALGPGRYETIVRLPDLDGRPMLTCTCPWRTGEIERTRPSSGYLAMLAQGLAESHGWDAARAAAYLGSHGDAPESGA